MEYVNAKSPSEIEVPFLGKAPFTVFEVHLYYQNAPRAKFRHFCA